MMRYSRNYRQFCSSLINIKYCFNSAQSKQEVSHIEDKLVRELVETYQQISSRRHDPIVQSLNALL